MRIQRKVVMLLAASSMLASVALSAPTALAEPPGGEPDTPAITQTVTPDGPQQPGEEAPATGSEQPSAPAPSSQTQTAPSTPAEAPSTSVPSSEAAPTSEVPNTSTSAPPAPGKRLAPTAVTAGCQTYPPTSFQVCGRIKDKYNQTGGPTGFLLFPKSNELTNPGNTGKRTEFIGGNIYWSAATDAHPVAHEFLTKWGEKGYEGGYLKYPTTDEIVLPGTVNRRQEYQGGSIYWAAGIGAHTIQGAIKDKWLALGGYNGALGYPTSDEKVTPGGLGRYNTFQHGSIYWSPATGAQAVSGEVLRIWAASGYEGGTYKYPTGGQTSTDNNTTVQQSFQGGVIKAPGPKIIQLSQLIPTTTPQEMMDDAIRALEDTAGTLETAIAEALQEAPQLAGSNPDPGAQAPLPVGRRTGDLVFSNADTAGVPHGHTGIYVTTTESVHALNAQRGVILIQSNDASSGELASPALYMVSMGSGVRERAAQWALSRVGSGYNKNFAFNKRDWRDGETGTYNCSQLVWGAFMNATDGQIDIDYGGGRGVYPKNIQLHPTVSEYQD